LATGGMSLGSKILAQQGFYRWLILRTLPLIPIVQIRATGSSMSMG
jgi:hypothetical protein